MMWGKVPLDPFDTVQDRTACVVDDEWELGGGPGVIRTAGVIVEVGAITQMVEFDGCPGFWWQIPDELVIR